MWQTLRGLNLEDKVFAVLYAATLFVVFFFAFRWVLWQVHDRVFGPFVDDGVDVVDYVASSPASKWQI